MTPLDIAKICHYANMGVCIAAGDFSQKSWELAEDWQREAAIHGVNEHLANPDLPAGQSHTIWMEKKLADGWTYGPTKNSVKKTHPDIKNFEDLDEFSRAKDIVFAAIVDSLRHLVD